MGFVHADRVKETTTTTGTGTYSLAGAAAGFRTFVAGVGTTNRCIYCVENGTDWEINEGVVTDAAPDTLSRARLLASSTGSAIDWGAGTKNIFAVYAAKDPNPLTRHIANSYSNSTTTGTRVGALDVIDLQPGTYLFEYRLILQSAATGTGVSLGMNFTGTHTALVAELTYPGTGAAASTGVVDDDSAGATDQLHESFVTRTESTTAPDLGPLTGVATASVDCFLKVSGIIVVTAVGNLELWAASEVGGSNISLMPGSSLVLTRTN